MEKGKEEMTNDMTEVNETIQLYNDESSDENVIVKREMPALTYRVEDTPPVMVTLMAAIQHILICFTSALSTASMVADAACVPYDGALRSRIFCTTLFMTGLCTVLQTALGVRLPIFQGPSASFLVPLLALQRDPAWACAADGGQGSDVTLITNSSSLDNITLSSNDTQCVDIEAGQYWRLQQMSGALILAALVEVVVGCSGLLNVLLRFIGPITVGVTIALIGTSLSGVPLIYGRPSFAMCFGCTALIVIFVLYMQNVAIPLPKCSKRSNNQPRSYFRIFQLLPILIAVLLIWIVSTILTSAGVFTSDKEDPSFLARSDAKLDIIYRSPWIQITYPGQFGLPKFHLALTLGFLVAFIASMMESVGDYYAAQVVCGVPRPPTHAISRGILMEGLGSVLSGAVGAGHATTSYSGNIAVLSLTKTASRIVMYTAGMMLIGLSLIGKAGAALTAIPNPIIGGILMVVVGTLISIGLSNLKHVDMTSSRNMLVVGVPFMAGIVMPRLLDSHPDVLDTGSEEANRILSVILGTPMFLGGMLALILDSTVPGTLESRGMGQNNHEHGHSEDESGENTDMLYSWPFYRRLCRFCPWLGHLPFLPGNSTVQLSDKHFNGKQKNGDSHAI